MNRGRLLPVLGLAALLLLAPGCDRRLAEIRESLGPEERALFDAGKQQGLACWSCHEFQSPVQKIGPSLLGVMGRRAGSVVGFPYSEAMRRSGIVWDRESLQRYLAAPSRVVPGTTMVWAGEPDPDRLAALVFYVEKMSEAPDDPP